MIAYFVIPLLLIIAFLPVWLEKGKKTHKLWGAVLVAVILSTGGGGYFLIGSPGLPNFPHGKPIKALPINQTQPVDIEKMVAGLHQRLKDEQSKNGEEWARLAHSYQVLERFQESLNAWQKVLEYSKDEQSLYAMALFRAGGVAHEMGEKRLAYEYLNQLRQFIPEDAKERESLERLIEEVSR